MNPMDLAGRLACEGVEKGAGGPFGAVVVKDGKVVGQACNEVVARNDPTAHAEVLAIREACKALDTFILDGCEIYTTSEPCPMCLAAIHWAHLDKIHYAQTRKDAAEAGFDDARFYEAMQHSQVPLEHVKNEAAAEAFRLWQAKEDRVDY